MKKLLVITHDLSESGAPIGLFNLCDELKKNWEIHVVSPIVGPLIDRFMEAGMTVQVIPSILEPVPPVGGGGGCAYTCADGYDAVLCNTLLTLHAVRDIKRHTKVRVIWSIHEVSEWLQSLDAVPEIAREAFNLADEVVTTCQYARELYQKYRNLPIVVSAPGIKVRDKLPEYPPHEGTRILMLGSIQRRKGHDIALRALGFLDDPTIQMAIVGSYADMGFCEECRKIPTGRCRVAWVGRVTEQQKQELLDTCDLVIVPSREDLINLNVLEAMEAGKPVVVSQAGGLWDVACVIENCYTFPNENAGFLADGIKYVMGTSNESRCLNVEWYRKLIRTQFSTERWARDFDHLLTGPNYAIREQIPGPFHVLPTSPDGEGVGGENAVDQIVA